MTPFLALGPQVVVRASGEDHRSYLDDVTTQRMADVETDEVRGALHLDAHGNPVAVMDVVFRPDDVLLLVPADCQEHVLEVLGGRTFLLDARFEPTNLAVLSVRGLDHDDVATQLGWPVPEDGRVADHEGRLLVDRPGGFDLVVDRDEVGRVTQELEDAGVAVGTAEDLEDWRIRWGIPRWGHEITAGHLPEELGLLPTHVHLAKGCYPGQEAVARMWMLGRPRRRLAVVRTDGDVTPGWEAGSGRHRAIVTSVTSDGQVALAFVPPDAEGGDRFEAGTSSIVVERAHADTLDVPGHDPRMTRRRDRRASETSASGS